MQKIALYILILLSAVISFTACEKWLAATPPSEIREDEQFSTAFGFEQALMGCYIGMSVDNLYGTRLTWQMTELLARQYNVTAGGFLVFRYLQNYNYSNSSSRTHIETIWRSGYNVIANANNALAFIESNGNEVLNPVQYKLIKGELLAIRAYMHFDLLRLFGFGDWEGRPAMAQKYTLPYITTIGKSITPQYKGSDYIQAILNDLTQALSLLADVDPVLGIHDVDFYADVNTEGFFNNRTKRLNYYAIKALMARVYMWEGSDQSKTQARTIAQETITALQQKSVVSWMTQTGVASNYALTTEAIFMVNVMDLSISTTQFLKLNLMDQELTTDYIHLTNSQASDLYETTTVGATDWRYTSLTYPGGTYRVPLKMYQTSTYSVNNNLVPLFRLPELYYIAAETYITGPNADLGKAIQLLDEVRITRGITTPLSISTVEEAKEELLKEYKKEFLCEGVVFFYYKRTGMPFIPQYTGEMTDAQYVLPFPDIEIENGRVQF